MPITNYSSSKAIQVTETTMGKYVDRGDPAAHDFTLVDIVQDNAWHDLNLSAIVALAGADHLVHLIVGVKATKSDNFLYFREKGNVNEINIVCVRTQSANVASDEDCLVLMDTTRTIQYKATADDWTGILISVRGWIED